AGGSKERYPHWDANDPTIATIDSFIQAHKGKGYVAAFDWDGTLYSETIEVKGEIHKGATRSGQSNWHLWGARQGHFPAFKTKDGDHLATVVRRDDYLEGKTNASLSGYSKFSQIATFEAGMTPSEMRQGVRAYARDYPPGDYAYLKMLDIVRQFIENGFQVWIVTGSNPYFVMSILETIDETMGYNLLAKGCDPTRPDLEKCRIVGNCARLSPEGRFTMVYNDRFVRINDASHPYFLERNIIDGAGKAVAIRNFIEPGAGKPVVFYAGNSGGDYESVQYVLNQKDLKTLVAAVNPRGTLTDLVARYQGVGKLVVVSAAPARK
ncbi:MAG: haloacid dehalogenase-like hydrolase, partial [Desulfobacterales bacterium]|nr:haloacid dehalogenase-like hydrolase [Desulfobacterales bacterium]